ncbi:MAG: ATP-binding protein [Gammaproteobacteria bacterium]|nr:ATP-binding protein [Gammaproteobacteria bacterium]
MKSSTGRWVSGDDFFDREGELKLLESRVRDGNHMVMTGQRRMGKTSILRELGRRMEQKGWVFLFADVEADRSEEDVITSLAKASHPVTPITSRLMRGMGRQLRTLAGKVDQVSALQFAVRFRAGLNAGNWRRHGEDLIAHCAGHDHPVLIVIDEVPIFLVRLLDQEHGSRRVDEFLSWLRAIFQKGDGRLPTLILSGSIGIAPLVERLGISDRINYLDPIRLGPWSLEVAIRCFETLTANLRPVR